MVGGSTRKGLGGRETSITGTFGEGLRLSLEDGSEQCGGARLGHGLLVQPCVPWITSAFDPDLGLHVYIFWRLFWLQRLQLLYMYDFGRVPMDILL